MVFNIDEKGGIDYMAFRGEKLREWRQSKGLSLNSTSAMFGITPQHLSCIERGTREPSGTLLEIIISATSLKYEALRNPIQPPSLSKKAARKAGAKRKAVNS